MSRARPPALRLYLWAVGLLLLVQGGVSLLVRAAGLDAHATSRLLSDPAHATIHVVWGVVVLGVLVLRAAETAEILVASVFGVFYLGLLALGLAVHLAGLAAFGYGLATSMRGRDSAPRLSASLP